MKCAYLAVKQNVFVDNK